MVTDWEETEGTIEKTGEPQSETPRAARRGPLSNSPPLAIHGPSSQSDVWPHA